MSDLISKMRLILFQYPLLASGWLAMSITMAQLRAPASYHWVKNTISDLGAQHYEKGWMMQLGFIGFGLLLVGGGLADLVSGQLSLLRASPVILYGLAVALTGIFCTQPFWTDAFYSVQESRLHSVLAQLAGLSFSVAIVVQLLAPQRPSDRAIHATVLLLVLGLSGSFKFFSEYAGLLQRVLYLVSLTWLSFMFKA
ncbi:DUF998 domain-containing protein [Larkinella knui]|nr:DUF998 domain-containing protein [Larkinella knui]